MPERYKVFFHAGDVLGLKTRVFKGEAWINETGLNVEEPGADRIVISTADIRKVKMFRLHGLGRVIQVDHRKGRLFLSVIRLMIGQFAFINFFRTGKLYNALAAVSGSN